MMLDHIGETEKSDRIKKAIAEVVEEGKVRCYDMLRISGGPKSIDEGACKTDGMTDAIIAKL
jgi:isocitrate dehydrogenase (NAD+)